MMGGGGSEKFDQLAMKVGQKREGRFLLLGEQDGIEMEGVSLTKTKMTQEEDG